MSIPYETPFHHDFSVDGKVAALNNFKTALGAAGWTTTATAGEADGTFSALPTDGQTITIDGVVYTAKNTPVGGNDFQIGADVAATATNLYNKINATHTTVTATNPSSGVVRVTAITAGPTDIAVSEAMTGFDWNLTSLAKDGYRFKSPATTEGLSGYIAWFHDGGDAGAIRVTLESIDGLIKQTDSAAASFHVITSVAGRRLRCISHKYGFYVYLANTDPLGVDGVSMQVFSLAVVAQAAPRAISDVTNSGGLIKITTATPHGLATGQSVHISGVTGVAANGTWTITVLNSTSYTLNGSTFSGAYTGGGAAAGPGQISQLFVGQCGTPGGGETGGQTYRTRVDGANNATLGPGGQIKEFLCVNGSFREGLAGGTAGVGRQRIYAPPNGVTHHSGEGVFSEGWHRFNLASLVSEGNIYGMPHNAGVFNAASIASDADSDKPFEIADLKIFWRYTWNHASGTLCVRVPGTNGDPPTATITVL